ncbi:hypothetical protein [Polyangium jinanense]|uniref:Uncharacterized protein n=1 Tax=Polyangium jinanense TaxID=2829994 RepID=A0A9X3XBM0_9BACT|nr:hypothetical protein [Polyangium jinanense]MDC3956010.1 hypothetical protein [Polyangium jinanense]MDC3961483.1 hypothetical protein [Polyangium jinanense]MDC3986370.1 hypothetical protein [Polyangium jinanense]
MYRSTTLAAVAITTLMGVQGCAPADEAGVDSAEGPENTIEVEQAFREGRESARFVNGYKLRYKHNSCLSSHREHHLLHIEHYSLHDWAGDYSLYDSKALMPEESVESCDEHALRTKVVISAAFSPNCYDYEFEFWDCS